MGETMVKNVLVIGAGPSGIAQCNALVGAEDVNVRCFEMNSEIGGLWTWSDAVGDCHASMYRYHQTNGLNEFLEYENYSFNEHFGHLITSYPPRGVMLDYVRGWARKMGGDQFITLNRKVHDVTYNEGTGKFKVISHDTKTDQRFLDYFDNISVCSGHFSVPNWPEPIPGIEDYPGHVMHAHSFRDACDYAGKDILFIGNGYSGEDIAMQCVKFGAKSAMVAYRTAARNMDFKDWNISERPVAGLHFDKSSGEFKFDSGAPMKADVIIYCTGYLHSFPFLSGDLDLKTSNRLVPDMLWKGIVHPNNTKLTFIGMPDQYYTFTKFYAMSMFVRGLLEGRVQCPTKEEMLAHTAEWQKNEDVAHASGDHADHHRLQLAYTNDACQMAGFTLRDDGHLLIQWQADRDRDILKYRDCTAPSQVDGSTSLEFNVPWTMMFTDDNVSYLAWCKAKTAELVTEGKIDPVTFVKI